MTEIKKPDWNDIGANRVMYPNDFDESGNELSELYPIRLTRSEQRRLDELAKSNGYRVRSKFIKAMIFNVKNSDEI